MTIIKLGAIDSTNTYLKQFSVAQSITDYTMVMAEKQFSGRGQMGTVWDSETSKNLTCSVFKNFSALSLDLSFYISMVTALALFKTLDALEIPKLSIKWPNDILAGDKKICGVLIENVVSKQGVRASVIGIGLNVNQTKFDYLPRASSLKIIMGKNFNIEEIAVTSINNLRYYFDLLADKKFEIIKSEYELRLFRRNKPSTFKHYNGAVFSGYIKGVSKCGALLILLEGNIIKSFSLKEVTLLY